MGLSTDGMDAGRGPNIAAALFISSRSVSAAKSGEAKNIKNSTQDIVRNVVDRRSAMGFLIMLFIAILLVIMPGMRMRRQILPREIEWV
jgi:hypothetical protein